MSKSIRDNTLTAPTLEASKVLAVEPVNESTLASPGFNRNRLTWFGYIMHGYWSYVWAAFGAFVPFLRSEFNIDYSTAALHFSALALGPFMAGFIGDKVIHALGLTKTIALGTTVVLAGLVSVVAGPLPALTIGGAWMIGFGGSLMGQSVTTSMAQRFGEQRSIGFTELQIFGTLCSLLAPLTVCAAAKSGVCWRTTLLSSVVVVAVVLFTNFDTLKSYGRVSQTHKTSSAAKLTLTYWLYFLIIFFSVASEWTVAFWSPEFMSQVLHLPKEDAAIGMSAFLFAMLTGRILGVTVLKRVNSSRLLIASAWLAALGFIVFWCGRDLYVCILGVLLMGLGEANVYPLCFSRAIAAVVGAPGKAASRMSISTGGAILLAPLFLGMLADKIGICQSYGMVAVSLIMAAIAVSLIRQPSFKSLSKV